MNYITKINGLLLDNIEQYMQNMVAEVAHRLDIREMGLYRYNADGESVECLNARIDGIIAGMNRGDLIICQFPTGNGLNFERALINHLRAYGGRIAIFIHSVRQVIETSSELQEIINLYNQAEVMIIPSLAIRHFLIDNHIRKNMKFVIQEMWDYITDANNFNIPQFKKELAFLDIGYGRTVELRSALPLKEYKVSDDLCIRKNLCGFGLIWYGDENNCKYMEYAISLSLGKFLAAGIPVIIPAGILVQSLIEKNHLGLVVDSLNEVMVKVNSMNESEYQGYVHCVRKFAPAMRSGYYTKKCLIEALHAFYRKDAEKLYIPEKIYKLKNSVFLSTILKESYGGNLALSWNFKGDTDGFLIYDANGKLIVETDNILQHYYLIKGYEKESFFIVKAYVKTLNGKMIIAESESIHLEERRYDGPKVSLIIPAYNAEDYVARSIDTALAQSFSDLEIIIVNDGSTDRTSEILDWYAEKYNNISVIHQKNSGVPVARNTGIKRANGEYIGFMDNDDMMQPNMIERMYSSAKKNESDIVCTSAYEINTNGYEVFMRYPMQEDTAVLINDFFSMHFSTGCMFTVNVWNKLYKANLVKTHLFPTILYDDEAWTPYIFSHASKVCYLDDCLYEHDRTIRNSTLIDEWRKIPRDELFNIHRSAIMFYLENSNSPRLGLLKQLAKRQLCEMRNAYAYDAYEKLWEWIEKMF